MIKTFNAAKYVKLTPKKKLEYLKEVLRDPKFKDIFVKVYDKNIKYGVRIPKKKFNEVVNKAIEIKKGDTCDYDKVLVALDKIFDVRQSERKQYINQQIKSMNCNEIYLFLAAIMKDMGISYKHAAMLVNNKELKYYPFMLAHKYDFDIVKHSINDKVFLDEYETRTIHIQPKLDGMRLIYIPKENIFVTRNQDILTLKSNPNLKYIVDTFEKLADVIKPMDLDHFVFDGEVFADNWNNTMTIVHTEQEITNVDFVKKLNFYIFDIIPYVDFASYNFESDIVTEEILDDRYEILIDGMSKELVKLDERYIKFVKSIKVPKDKVTHEFIAGWLNIFVNKYNFEGTMIKLGDEFYYEGRKNAWMKFKPEKELDCVIIDMVEGDGRHVNKLGALICKAIINNKEVTFKVGSGFSDEQREYFWNNKDNLIGKIVEINYQELTKDNIPRFPIFKRIRIDKSETS